LISGKNWTEIVGDLLLFQETKENIDVQDIQFSFQKRKEKKLNMCWKKEKSVSGISTFEKSSFINPEKLIRENFHNSLQNLDNSFHDYEKRWDEIQSLIIDFKPVYEEKKNRILVRIFKNYHY
jgi:hypothetical protein